MQFYGNKFMHRNYFSEVFQNIYVYNRALPKFDLSTLTDDNIEKIYKVYMLDYNWVIAVMRGPKVRGWVH